MKPFNQLPKFIAVAMLLLLVAIGTNAQTFDQLWRKAELEYSGDLPKSAIATVREIQQKAVQEANYPQLLKARIIISGLQGNISLDSLRVEVSHLEKVVDSEKNPCLSALYHLGIATVLLNESKYYGTSERARHHLQMALAKPEILANAKAKDFLPAVSLAKKPGYEFFGGDLLNVVARCVFSLYGGGPKEEVDELYLKVIKVYQKQNNVNACILFGLDLFDLEISRVNVKKQGERLANYYKRLLYDNGKNHEASIFVYQRICEKTQSVDTLMKYSDEALARFGNSPYIGQIKNLRNDVLSPSAQLHSPKHSVFIPNRTYDIQVVAQSASQVKVQMCRTNLNRLSFLQTSEKDLDVLKNSQLPVIHEETIDFGMPDFHKRTRTFSYTPREPGIYLWRIIVDGKVGDREFITVSGVTLISQTLARDTVRFIAVNSQTGKPLKGATLSFLQYNSSDEVRNQPQGKPVVSKTVRLGADGTHIDTVRSDFFVIASTKNDDYANFDRSEAYRFFPFRNNERKFTMRTHFFLDREFFRPGQEVKFSGVIYEQLRDSVRVRPNHRTTITFNGMNGQTDSMKVTTNEMGQFSGSFRIPENVLSGGFILQDGDRTGFALIRCENYKRPTFTVGFEGVGTAFRIGDTVQVRGKAQTVSGLPMPDAKVKYRIQLKKTHGAYHNEWADAGIVLSGEITTDADGFFSFTLPLTEHSKKPSNFRYTRLCFDVKADVTASNLETRTASMQLMARKSSYLWSQNIPDVSLRSRLKNWEISLKNADYIKQTKSGTYQIFSEGKAVANGTFTTNTPFVPSELSKLPSGKYKIAISIPTEQKTLTDTTETLLFGLDDKRPPVEKELFTHFDEATSTLLVGTSLKDVTMFFDIGNEFQTFESRRIKISESMQRINIPYRNEYGDGIIAVLSFCKNGKVYEHEKCIAKPEPDKRLVFRWETFRNHLRAGSTEEWKLRITYPNGKPAPASLMATLYDASLDLIATSFRRPFNLRFYRSIGDPHLSNNLTENPLSLTARNELPRYDIVNPSYDYFFPADYEELFQFMDKHVVVGGSRVQYIRGAGPTASRIEKPVVTAFGSARRTATAELNTNLDIRTNFEETAMFVPSLRTDADGRASLVFTLPQSLTKWQFRAFAHTADMHFVEVDTTAVATKEFMVQTNLPRFLRRGDRTSIASTLTNLTSTQVDGTARMEVFDPETEHILYSKSMPFSVAPNGSQTLAFPYETDGDHNLIAVRIIADGKNFSDGEQRYLPILSERTQLTASLPILLKKSGTFEFNINSLLNQCGANATNKTLSIELTNNPSWYAVMALPNLLKTNADDAYSLATNYYAHSIADLVARQNPSIAWAFHQWSEYASDSSHWWSSFARNPELKQTLLEETPWLADSESEKVRFDRLSQFLSSETSIKNREEALHKLLELQTKEGGWTWFKGMKPNRYTSVYIAVLLARIQNMVGLSKEAEDALKKTFAYLDKEIDAQLRHDRELAGSRKTPLKISEWQAQYLYASALVRPMPAELGNFDIDTTENSNFRILLKLLEDESSYGVTMYGKAVSAVILARSGRTKQAQLALKSLMEQTVYSPDMGRYFSTKRAIRSYSSYAIPTQSAAIEALQLLGKASSDTIDDMRLWLLQSKRTQSWGNPRTTIDAIHALLSSASDVVSLGTKTAPLKFEVINRGKIVADNTSISTKDSLQIGYVYAKYPNKEITDATQVRVQKSSAGISWGAIYGTYTLPTAEIKSQTSGIRIQRKIEVLDGSQWSEIGTNQVVKAGSRIRITYLVDADRGYDFVTVRTPRTACLEPLNPTSGYNGLAYRTLADASLSYHFDHLAKGRTTLVDFFAIDRTGTFQSGAATAQCLYAPEFGGQTEGFVMKVE